ncbi:MULTISPECIES: DUF4827 family protein [Parabacteroides]|uniref:DUF4827 domain-containing protein n=1 Tax=Parabacteroides chinchillae TaxID=871327 RepID=A0A8G2BU10_9BACT|nr:MULTISPECIES: DUF4827 family protein [Parabacteroides]SEF40910.1 protein of unknown function [Parabacteroides chinchillae]
MKKGFNFLLIVCAALVAISCSKTKTYTDMLKAEKKAINRLIDEEGIEVLDDYPEDGVFKPNQFVKLDNDVYLNVIDSGNGQRAVLGQTQVLCRFIAKPLLGDTSSFNTLSESNTFPVEFTYGINQPKTSYYADFVGEGLASGLAYVGDSSYVKLIVPFKRFTQQTYFNTNGIPVYFKKVRYIFEK